VTNFQVLETARLDSPWAEDQRTLLRGGPFRPDSMDIPRGLPDNPAQARRARAAAELANPTPPPPVPSLRDVPSSSNLPAGQPISPSQVLVLAREAMRAARENEAKAAEASGVSNSLRPGLTIDLSGKNIQALPE